MDGRTSRERASRPAKKPAKSRAGTAHLRVFVPYQAKVGANFKGGAMETSFDTAYLQCTEVPGKGLQSY